MLRITEHIGLTRRSFVQAGILGLGGLGLADCLRLRAGTASPTRKDTCVILITGYASTTTAIDALRQGAYDYITKPFDLWETAKAIERGLESRFLVIENRRLVT